MSLYEKSKYELREGERAVSRSEHEAMIAEFRKDHPKPDTVSLDPIWKHVHSCHECHREGTYANGTKCWRCDGAGYTFDGVAIIPSAAERLADLKKSTRVDG